MNGKAGVVVIGRNEGERLQASLESVLPAGVPSVYVDSGSTDGSLERAEALGIATHALDPSSPFSAARARNEGFVSLLGAHPDLDVVLFLDGDCTIDAEVLPKGMEALERSPRLGLVCSPVREKDYVGDLWKTLCDLEWDQPVGPMLQCGGIFMIRTDAFRSVGGMHAGIPAGEEPEMCRALLAEGWELERIGEGLVEHDVGAFGLRDWWRRSRRSGLAFLLGFLHDGRHRGMGNLREVLRPWLWGLILPLIILVLTLYHGAFALLLAAYPIHLANTSLRIRRRGRPWREANLFAAFNLLGRWAEISGQLRLLFGIALGTLPSVSPLRDSPITRTAESRTFPDLHGNKVGIVVIGRNEGERLRTCLEALEGMEASVVYVDSGSIDGSSDVARGLGFKVVELDDRKLHSAARARNAGFRHLTDLHPDLDAVQFLDGDCILSPKWLDDGLALLRERPEIAAVSGRRREMHPQTSVYNRLADFEWDLPLGLVKWCGGDAMFRADAFRDLDGYTESLIACEELELCYRARRDGWGILRIPSEMSRHDANITRFSQWWRRCVRTGHSYLQAASLHRHDDGRFLRREIRSGLIWGVGLPVGLALTFFLPWLLLPLVLISLLNLTRILMRRRNKEGGERHGLPALMSLACFTLLTHAPIAVGMSQYLLFRASGRRSSLIEYK